ncbi:MazG nucleotide pyrophosphohydrolase domain-containing protein [Nocardia abscessus]|uniref:MazG nucleotide pyrophosphohydrolase domain-containing protein n=1 Tax=Nocardia abscessus TaxID=120957 RepID=UPI002455A63C|nr:MazG nucleotide pyrophosphohydrolase domain-containing protein [Nocardia abscessus]
MEQVVRVIWQRRGHSAARHEVTADGGIAGWTSGAADLDATIVLEIENVPYQSDSCDTPRLLRVEKTEAGFELYVSSPNREAILSHAGPVIVALAAQLHGWVALRGQLMRAPGDAEKRVLVFSDDAAHAVTHPPDGIQVLVDTTSWPARGLELRAQAPDAGSDESAAFPCEVTAIAIVAAGGELQYLDAKAAHAYVGSRLFSLDALAVAQNGALVFSSVRRVENLRLQELTAGLPAFHVPVALLRAGAELPEFPRAPAEYTDQQLEAIRAMQSRASAVYGYLEPDRAIVWALEEMGELAQAIRRRESPSRISEEIGQLFNWMLCLANICEVDLATAASVAVGREGFRQITVHGGLRPRARSKPFRSRT